MTTSEAPSFTIVQPAALARLIINFRETLRVQSVNGIDPSELEILTRDYAGELFRAVTQITPMGVPLYARNGVALTNEQRG